MMAAVISAVAFLIGLCGVQLATKATLSTKLLLALMPAGMAFIATLLLCGLDRLRFNTTVRSVKRALLKRHDISEQAYTASFPEIEPLLSSQVRQAVASVFQAPATKIHPTDQLRSDLRFDKLEVALIFGVIQHVLAARGLSPTQFIFKREGMENLGDLTREIQRMLQRLDAPE